MSDETTTQERERPPEIDYSAPAPPAPNPNAPGPPAAPPPPVPKLDLWKPRGYHRHEMPVMTPSRDIVRGLLGGHETGAVFGKRSTLKSQAALALAVAVDVGGCWANDPAFPVQHPGGTLYLAGEGARGIRLRLDVLDPDRRARRIILVGDVPQIGAAMENRALLAQAIEHLKRVRDQYLPHDPLRLIFIDTWTLAVAGLDRNSELGPALPLVRDLLEALANDDIGCAAALVGHEGKGDGRGWIGDSAQEANVDWILRCFKDPKLGRGVVLEKEKDRPDDIAWPFDAIPTVVTGPEYEEGQTHVRLEWGESYRPSAVEKANTAAKETAPQKRKRVIREILLAAAHPLTRKLLKDALAEQGIGPSEKTLTNDIKALVDAGVIEAIGPANEHRTYRVAQPPTLFDRVSAEDSDDPAATRRTP